MAVRIVEGQLPYSAGTGINITANKVIEILLRDNNNLIEVNNDNELYVDLQLASGMTPTDTFPVGVTVGQVNSADGWISSGTLLNFQTTSGDYGRWLYGTDGHMYYDHGTGVFTQIYSSTEVDNLFTQLRNSLATVAFTGDYGDLINRPVIPVIGDGTLTINQNGVLKGTFTANQQGAATIDLVDTTYPTITAGDMGTGTSTVPSVTTAKAISDFVNGKISNVYTYKGSVNTYADLPSTNLTVGDVYNVATAHTTAPIFPAGSNLAWDGSAWDVLGGEMDLSAYELIANKQTDLSNPDNTHYPTTKAVSDALSNLGVGDMKYVDFNFDTLTGASVTLDLSSVITPSANFTVNAPATLEDGQVYVLRVTNGATAYTMTLGTNITNPSSVDLTLTANAIDMFVFLCVGGKLELQPEMPNDVQLISNMKTDLTSPDNNHYPTTKAVSDALSGLGGGDMLKSVYDPNNIEANAFDYNNFINTPTIQEGNIVTQTQYNNLPSSKLTDGNFYIIYSS